MAKLNIGSSVARGIYRGHEWVNLDIKPFRGVNVIGSGFCLPFRDNSFIEIHTVHVLEHLTRDKIPIMLKELARVSCGDVYIEVPDFRKIVYLLNDAYTRNDYKKIHVWRTSIYGKSERPGMSHHFGFDFETLNNYMTSAGFKTVIQLTNPSEMISEHYLQEPVILVKASKN